MIFQRIGKDRKVVSGTVLSRKECHDFGASARGVFQSGAQIRTRESLSDYFALLGVTLYADCF